MSLLFFYDTETSGLPDWKSPSEAEHQPHIVQAAGAIVDSESRETIASVPAEPESEPAEFPSGYTDAEPYTGGDKPKSQKDQRALALNDTSKPVADSCAATAVEG